MTVQELQSLATRLQTEAGQIQLGILDGMIRVESAEDGALADNDDFPADVRITDGVEVEYHTYTGAVAAIEEWVHNLRG